MQKIWNADISDDVEQFSKRDGRQLAGLESTSTLEPTENPTLSAAAVVGVVIGSVVVAIAVVVTVVLVRYYSCLCFDRRKALADEFTVSYSRSELDACDSSTHSDPKTLAPVELDGHGVEGMKKPSSDPAIVHSEFKNEESEAGQMKPQTLGTGIENPGFATDNQNTLSTTNTTDAKNTTDATDATTAASKQIPSDFDFRRLSHISSNASLCEFGQENRGNNIRRSYHLDRGMASAIAAQRNREMSVLSIFSDSDLNSQQDVVIVFRARTAL